jgi:hypothetical protein
MEIVEEHRTPDGLYRFIVERSDDGDLSLGFDGFPSHTHGDILASLADLPVDAAIREYIDDLLNGRTFIAVAAVEGTTCDVWVTDNGHPDEYKPDDETIEFRYWDGRQVRTG